MSGRAFDPVSVPAEFWTRDAVRTALNARDFGALFRLVRRYSGASQTRIATAVGFSQGRVSEIMAGTRRVASVRVIDRVLAGLGATDAARVLAGLAPSCVPADQPQLIPDGDGDAISDLSSSIMAAHSGVDDGIDSVRRRELFELGTPPVAGVALAGLARALIPALVPIDSQPVSVAQICVEVGRVKSAYQSCRYVDAAQALPSLLHSLDRGLVAMTADERQELLVLHADAHRIAASVLLKLGDSALASVAADRSMRSALESGNPLTLGSSARVLTHTLISTGHPRGGRDLVSDVATRLETSEITGTTAGRSVYGALLLRGSIAAAHGQDRDTSHAMLDRASTLAKSMNRDANHEWTAFGPTNVLLHRVNVAVTLGEAGAALRQAARIDLRSVAVIERRAALFINAARALAQWGKLDRAFRALLTAERIAREEVARPAVCRLVGELAASAPRSIQADVRDFATRIGATT